MSTKLKVGTLFIVTYKGGTLGREGSHEVLIPDINISKYHIKFTYNNDKKNYEIVDMGSRNGSILNGKRMSTAMKESDVFELAHGSELLLSQTKILCHIHEGNVTCNDCEPGIVSAKWESNNKKDLKSVSVEESRKIELKRIRKKYGLETESKLQFIIIYKMLYNFFFIYYY